MPPYSRPRSTGGGARRRAPASLAVALLLILAACSDDRPDLVLAGGRVVDPESGLDGIRWLAIDDGRVIDVSSRSLGGGEVMNLTGFVVAPGFIDLHASAADSAGLAALALSGVTSALLLEPGVHPVAEWLAAREGRSPIHFGAAVSYAGTRAEPFALRSGEGASLADQPLDGTAMEALVRGVRRGLADGAVGLGFARADAPGASAAEIEDLFAVVGFDDAPVFARPARGGLAGLDELLAAASLLGTRIHLVDLAGWSADSLPVALARIDSARAAGLDVTADVRLGEGPSPAETLAHPGVIVADDHGGGRFLRMLARFLEGEPGSLRDALARVTVLPARRLERTAPEFRGRGRIGVGADADLVVIDPETATVRHVIVGGVVVVKDGVLVPGVRPGRAVRSQGWL